MLLMKILKLCVVMLLISGCTVIPKHPTTNVPSFDGNSQNSGVIGFTDDHYIIITQEKLAQYDALISVYGSKFYPAIKLNDGIQFRNNQILIDKEHFVKLALMLDMNRKQK